jgi:hemerythrin-like domain-containing protein
MKRDKNLQPLSRQHHNALMAVLLLKKGFAKNADAEVMKHFILSVWKDELKEHFEMEEQLLSAHDENDFLSPLINQMRKEHEIIKEMIGEFLPHSTSLLRIEQFYQILEQHIRFEERVLYPAVEKNLSEDALNQLGTKVSVLPQNSCINFPVKFWE